MHYEKPPGAPSFLSEINSGNGQHLGELIDVLELVRYPVPEMQPPKHLPPLVTSAFMEGARCLTVSCWNAATVMFRTALDLATKHQIPEDCPRVVRNRLARRLEWLFENGKIPPDLQELSKAIKDDGNDAAHDLSITKIDAQNTAEFAYELLRAIYTIPKERNLRLKDRNRRVQERS